MPLVVSNSSPIIHLAKIGHLDLLRIFYGNITVPHAVWQECTIAGKGRAEVAHIAAAGWIKTVRIQDRIITILRHEIDHGEAEAIALALEKKAALLLLDDAEAREKARLYNIAVTGTIGILLRARREMLIPSLRETLQDLMATGFWLHDRLAARLLAEVGE